MPPPEQQQGHDFSITVSQHAILQKMTFGVDARNGKMFDFIQKRRRATEDKREREDDLLFENVENAIESLGDRRVRWSAIVVLGMNDLLIRFTVLLRPSDV